MTRNKKVQAAGAAQASGHKPTNGNGAAVKAAAAPKPAVVGVSRKEVKPVLSADVAKRLARVEGFLKQEEVERRNAMRAMDLILCPDQIDTVQESMPVLPVRSPKRQVNSRYYGNATPALQARNILITAAGQHSACFRMTSTSGAAQGNDLLMVNLGKANLSWDAAQLPSGFAATFTSRLVPDACAGFMLQANSNGTGGPMQLPIPTPITYAGKIWIQAFDGINYTMYQFDTSAAPAQVLLCGEVNWDAGKSPTANPNFGMTFSATQPGIFLGDTTMTVVPILFENGADVRSITEPSGSYQFTPLDSKVSAGVYSATNHKIKLYSPAIQQGMSVRNYFVTGGDSGPFGMARAIAKADAFTALGTCVTLNDLATKSNQSSMAALTPGDRDWGGCNIRAGLVSVDDMVSEISQQDLANLPGGMVPVVPNSSGGRMVVTNNPDAGWGSCCGFSITFLESLNGVAPVNLQCTLRADSWKTSFVTVTSGLPSVCGMWHDEFIDMLQEAALWPGLASYHSFKDFFKSALSTLKKVGMAAGQAALGAVKDVVVSAAVPALLAL